MKLVKFTNTVVITDPIVDESSFGGSWGHGQSANPKNHTLEHREEEKSHSACWKDYN